MNMYGEQPFWFWNGNINKDEVRRQIKSMHDGGAKGFFLHPRQGMTIPYMSKTFLDTVKEAVYAAKELNMEMWLYDEYPYPSGVAGGEVLENGSYRARLLTPYRFEGTGHIEYDLRWGKVLYAKAFPVVDGSIRWQDEYDISEYIGIIYDREIYQGGSGLSVYNKKRFFTGGHLKRLIWDAPKAIEKWEIFVFIEHEIDDFKYFGSFVDPLNKEAIKEYINFTHERYKKAFGEEFGKTVKGIFTDETAPNSEQGIYWSALLPKLFEERNGYSLIDRLPALICDTDGDDQKFLYDFNSTVYEAFVDSYDKPIKQWCEKNGLLYTGEKPHLRGEQISFMHIAGLDNGHQKVGAEPALYPSHYRASAKVVASGNHFAGHNITLCEAYHSVGWDMTLRDMRWMADWMGIDGVNLFVPHAFYYSEDSLRKHDAPPSAFENMPWWQHNRLYSTQLETLGEITREGKRQAKVLVIDPMFVKWTKRGGEVRGATTPLTRLMKALSLRHIDYYVVDRDVLKKASFAEGRVIIGNEEFTSVLLPGMDCLENESEKFVYQAADNSVRIFALDSLPIRNISNGKPLDIVPLLSGIEIFKSENELAAQLCAKEEQLISIKSEGRECENIQSAAFELDGHLYLYTLNKYKEPVKAVLDAASTDAPVALIDTVTGKKTAIPASVFGGHILFEYEYAPFECALFALGCVGEKEEELPACDIPIDRELPMRLAERNLLRMGKWQANLGGSKAVVEPMPVIDQLIKAGGSIEAEEKSDFGCVKKLVFPKTKLEYSYKFIMNADCPLTLSMEPGAVSGEDIRILVNGNDVYEKLKAGRVYSRENISCDISGYIKSGENEIKVTLTAKADHDGLQNAIYIAGDFSCYMKDGIWNLSPKKSLGRINDRIGAGIPFYCGDIEYDISGIVPETACGVKISDWRFEDACELIVSGVSLGAKGWNPYVWKKDEGAREVILKVSTTLLSAYEGQYFDVGEHKTYDIDPL